MTNKFLPTFLQQGKKNSIAGIDNMQALFIPKQQKHLPITELSQLLAVINRQNRLGKLPDKQGPCFLLPSKTGWIG